MNACVLPRRCAQDKPSSAGNTALQQGQPACSCVSQSSWQGKAAMNEALQVLTVVFRHMSKQ